MDNKEEIDLKVQSEEEQQKILAEISKEEIVDLNSLPRKEVEAIYIEDTPLKALNKLLTLSQSPLQERLVYVRHLGELLSILSRDGIDNLAKILEQVLNDADEIKKSLIQQLPYICFLLSKQLDGYQLIKIHVIPALYFFLDYDNLDIKEEAGNEIVRIAPYLTEEDRGNLVLKQVINMSHDEQNENNRIVAVQLFGKLSFIFGQPLVESFIAFEIMALGEDMTQRVRKEALLQIANVGKSASFEFVKAKKCDDKAWAIRKTCLEIIVDISRICTLEMRETELTNQMIAFFKDANKWVKAEGYKHLGAFIETLRGSTKLNDKLLEEYCKMLTQEIQDYYSSENEIVEVCAYYFPAVLATYGLPKWAQLSKIYFQMLKSNYVVIKKPLACSLHEVAKILGAAKAEKELIPVLDQILKDQNDEVKQGAIKNLWQFMTNFESNKRDNLLDVFLILFVMNSKIDLSKQKDQKADDCKATCGFSKNILF